MYSKAEASNIKKEFWTAFGTYMKPIKNAVDEKINWINYKTGIRDIYFRMDADRNSASIAIEIKHRIKETGIEIYSKFESLDKYFNDIMQEEWVWQVKFYDTDGSTASRIFINLDNVSIFKKEHWPDIITFLKERIIKLDKFWNTVKFRFEVET